MKAVYGSAILIALLSIPAAAWPQQPSTLPLPRWLSADAPQTVPAPEDEGPADGLALDSAIDRLVLSNDALRVRFLEISEAQADELTASLRNSPAIFLSGDALPYGRYSEQRPGAAQYEIAPAQNVDYSGKRRSHMRQARAATQQVEALYLNAVREEIDHLCDAYVAALEARQAIRLAQANLQWLMELEEQTRQQVRQGRRTESEADRIGVQRFKAEVGLEEAQGQQSTAKRDLATLLGISPDSCNGLALRGSLQDRSPPPPCAEKLLRLALESRPDLKAERLGIEFAQATVQAERAETFDDAIVFYSPCEAQNFAPQGKRVATAWGGGAGTILPIFDRNQGEIARARINVSQTEIELRELERRVANEVLRARTDYETSHEVVRRYEQEGLPAVRRLRDEKLRRFLAGQEQLDALLGVHNDFNETARQYLEVLAHHRRTMLALNTAVGQRLLP